MTNDNWEGDFWCVLVPAAKECWVKIHKKWDHYEKEEAQGACPSQQQLRQAPSLLPPPLPEELHRPLMKEHVLEAWRSWERKRGVREGSYSLLADLKKSSP